MNTKEMNIFRKLLEIANEIKPITKDMEVGKGFNSYKAVSEAQVKNEVKPIEYKYGVYSYPLSIDILHQETITTTSEYKGKVEEKTKFIVRSKIKYRFVNVDNPSEFVDQETFGDGVDPLDKSPGKAMTYAVKNGLINAYKMISGEDTDQTHSSENEIKKSYNKPSKNTNQNTSKPKSQPKPKVKPSRTYTDKDLEGTILKGGQIATAVRKLNSGEVSMDEVLSIKDYKDIQRVLFS